MVKDVQFQSLLQLYHRQATNTGSEHEGGTTPSSPFSLNYTKTSFLKVEIGQLQLKYIYFQKIHPLLAVSRWAT